MAERIGVPDRPELSLALPCYNEAACIRDTATELAQALEGLGVTAELVLVDNGSSDGTGEIIDALIAEGLPVVKVRVPVNRGYGWGVLQGLAACRAPWVGFLCADGQVAAADVARLYLEARAAGRPALVKVRRRFRQDGLRRKVISVAYNAATVALFGGLGSIDINGNPKLFPRAALEAMKLSSADWFLDPEVMIKARALGLPVVEVDVQARQRQGGRSNVGMGTCVEFAANLLRYRVRGAGLGEDHRG